MVDFTGMAHGFGHEGIVVVRPDGSAEYARFGPVRAGEAFGRGQVLTFNLAPVVLGPDGVPTPESFKQLVAELADKEGVQPGTVRMNYFATTDAGTAALQNYIDGTKLESDLGKLPRYNVFTCNCANYAVGGLFASGAAGNDRVLSPEPNTLYDQLMIMALESWANGATTLNPTLPKACVSVNNGPKTCTP